MSRVFVARDESLGREVVIKVLSPALSATLSAERFTREIKLAAALQEPHIVPVLAAGHTAKGLPWYSMPFVRGDSLRARLSAGRIPMVESIGILRNVAQALAYAHAHELVHRDIKPENVLLSSGTAVVTDFGIAKALAASKTQAPGGTLTEVGSSIGTPAYMAPEQASGDEVDTRADLYAWGVMAYEMLAGRHPFADKHTTQQLIAAHITEKPAELLGQLPGHERTDAMAQRLVALVMQCLEKQAADRPATARDVLVALDTVTTPNAAIPRAEPARRSHARAITAAAFLIAAVAAALFLRTRHGTLPLLEPKRVVVATFENRSGDKSLDPLGVMAADWIARGLANAGTVDVGGTAAELASRGVGPSTRDGVSSLQALARAAKAGIVISGAYYRSGDSVLFQADFTDANAGKLIQSVGPVSASAASPLDGVERLQQRVMGGLAQLVDSTLAGLANATSRPPSMEAYRELLAGEELYYKDPRASIAHYAHAASLDSTYVFPFVRMAGALDNLRDGPLLDSVSRLVEHRRALLTPYEQASFDFSTARMRDDLAEQQRDGAAMARLARKSPFAAYIDAIGERANGYCRAADSIFATLDPESGALRGRIYFFAHHAMTLHALGVFERELTVARRGRGLFPDRLLPYQDELRALAALGRVDDVNSLVTSVLRLSPDLDWTAARVVSATIFELRAHDHAAAAEVLSARLVAWLSARPADRAASGAGRSDRAEALIAAHHWEELQPLADSLVREQPDDLAALRLQGVALGMRGHREEARRLATSIENSGRRFYFGEDRRARAYIAAAVGDKEIASRLFEPTMSPLDDLHHTLVYELLRDYPPFQERIKPRG